MVRAAADRDVRRAVPAARRRAPCAAAAEWRKNKLTASEYDETTWSARTWMAFVTHSGFPLRRSCRWRRRRRRPSASSGGGRPACAARA